MDEDQDEDEDEDSRREEDADEDETGTKSTEGDWRRGAERDDTTHTRRGEERWR